AVLVARRDHVEELLDHLRVTQFGDGLTAGGKVALLADRHQLLDDRTKLLRLRQSRDDLLVLDQRRAHVGEHRHTMRRMTPQLAVNFSVTHRETPCLYPVYARDHPGHAAEGG